MSVGKKRLSLAELRKIKKLRDEKKKRRLKPVRRSRNRRNKKQKCYCDGWWFPHRAGSKSLNPQWPGCHELKGKW